MNPLAIDLRLTAWTLLTFAGLVFVLARYAFKPLRKALEERENRVRASLAQAEETRREAAETLARNEVQLEQARGETRRIISEGQRIVAEMKREAQAAAKKEAQQIVADARVEIERELRRGLDDLKGTVAGISLKIARQVIRENMDEARHREMVDDFLGRLKESRGNPRS